MRSTRNLKDYRIRRSPYVKLFGAQRRRETAKPLQFFWNRWQRRSTVAEKQGSPQGVWGVTNGIHWTWPGTICWKRLCYVRFEVFTAVTIRNAVSWDMMPCGSCKNRSFGWTYRLHQVGKDQWARNNAFPSLLILSTLMMLATCSAESSFLQEPHGVISHNSAFFIIMQSPRTFQERRKTGVNCIVVFLWYVQRLSQFSSANVIHTQF
jgi:hypothetical protein